jgi:tripartite ATP-independent transporter DctM subunit
MEQKGKLAQLTNSLQTIIKKLSGAFYIVAVATIAVMMFICAADTILRYFFNSPILGTIEIIEFLMAALVFLGLAYTSMHKGHINVDVISSRFSPRVQAVFSSITCFLTLGVFAMISWRCFVYAALLKKGNYFSATWHIPIYPFLYVAAVGAIVICLVLIFDFKGYIDQVFKDYKQWRKRAALLLLMIAVWTVFALPLWGMEWIGGGSPLMAGVFFTVLLIVIMFSGMSVGVVMALIGFLGLVYVSGATPAFSLVSVISYGTSASYTNSVIPLFVLMGVFCFQAGLSSDLYYAAYKWLARLPGGLAMATIAACAGFAAVSGSGAATAATMGTVALPEMKKYKYDSALATGCVAAGGTLGILIPPSIPLVIYGVLTQQSIGKLFLAGIIPGILQAIFYIVTIYILCKKNPSFGPTGPSVSLKDKVVSLKNTWGVIVLFLLVIGGLYFGVFTPTEAAGVGAFGAFIFALSRRRLNWNGFTKSLVETGITTGMIVLLLIGGNLFGQFLTLSRLPSSIAAFMTDFEMNRYIIIAGMVLIYIILGCIMSSMTMIIITVPIFFPVITALGFNPIWFGILVVRMVEIGAITPPVGLNVFILKGIAKDVPMSTIFRGIMPFLYADVVHVILLIAVPGIVLLVPNLMK